MCYTPGVQKGHFLLTLYNHLDITKFQLKQSSFYMNLLKGPDLKTSNTGRILLKRKS